MVFYSAIALFSIEFVIVSMSIKESKIRSDAGIFPWLTYLTMKDMGLDTDAIFSSVNFLEHALNIPDKNVRYDNRIQEKFWAVAEKVSGNKDIGLVVGGRMPVLRGDLFEYVFLSSSTFGQGLNTAIKYYHLFTSAFDVLKLEVKGEDAYLIGLEHSIRHYLECAISILLAYLKHVSNEKFKPLEVWLTYREGADAEQYQEIWGCPVYFNMPEGCIKFNADILNDSSVAANKTLNKIHETIIEESLTQIEKHELVFKIENTLQDQLKSGNFKIDDIAKTLNITSKALRTDLKEIGTSYEKVLNEYRQKLARDLLENTQLKSDEVVYLLGFSEPSAFSRAFKYWTGETPSQYRKRKSKKIITL
ncbi:Transcriptional activator NphR [compost metagenome]